MDHQLVLLRPRGQHRHGYRVSSIRRFFQKTSGSGRSHRAKDRRRIHHGGHARMLPILGKALGVSRDEMIECELIPEARGLVDFFVRSWIDIPLAECFAVHMEEEIFGFISRDFQQSLPQYGVSKDDMKYFRVHEEADLDEDHGGTNQAILEV